MGETASRDEKPRSIEIASDTDSVKEQLSVLHSPSAIRSLDEFKSPFETEAETTILRAIEYNEKARQEEYALDDPEKTTTAPSILAGVPASAMHLFDQVFQEPKRPEQFVNREQAAVSPLEPTRTATPSLKDIASRMRMMQMATKNKSVRNLNGTNRQEDADNVASGDDVDPESLTHLNQTGDMEGSDHSGNQSGSITAAKESGRSKSVYRRYCVPCYTFTSFLSVRWKDIKYALKLFIGLMTPLLGLSAILFYWAGNPIGPLGASYSWWLNFIVRQSITFLLAQMTEFILIDFIALETRLAVLAIGRMLTLMAMQAKGWPMLILLWSIWDIAILHGTASYNSHWLFMQDMFNIFNEHNQSGNVVSNIWYRKTLGSLIFVGVVVMIKRVLVALTLGKKNYGEWSF